MHKFQLQDSSINHTKPFLPFFFNCKNCIQKWILQDIFSRRCSNCMKNKIVHNFLITNPNEMNKIFLCRQKYNLGEKKFKFKFWGFFAAHRPLFWAYVGIIFVLGHQLKKYIYSYEANHFFYLPKTFQKIMTKNQRVGTCPKSRLSPERTMVF